MKLRQDGFTLVELLIAVALLALVMSMLATALTASVKVVEAVSEEDDAALQAQTALRRLSEDLNTAYAEPALPFRAGQGEAQYLEEDLADTLSFASLGHLVFNPQEQYRGPALISYRVETQRDDRRRLKLLRADVPLLLGAAGDEEAVEDSFLLLADGLRAVEFEALNERGETWRYSAVAGAGGLMEVSLPAAVRIRLDFWLDVDKGRSRVYETAVLVPVGLIRARPQRGTGLTGINEGSGG
ncbi:MAG: prepilin-type N-terminal cleavage/methylation domain-containing protein [bacterium]|nr:prepilin-type N-terminal cleavage/methylation domain-containing protein [bacterium]